MNFRIFSKSHNLYTNSPFWPSNQRTTSEFVLRPDGKILEIIDSGACGASVETCDSRNYIAEPWTGYFDSAGKKIYRGDLLEFSIFGLKNEVKWGEGSFVLFDLTSEHCDLPMSHGKYFSIVGNVHGVEYSD